LWTALAAATFAAGCQGGGGGGRGDASIDGASDVVPADVVRVVKKESAPDGRVTYVLENVSGKLQEDLTYHVEFHYDYAAAPGDSQPVIKIADDIEFSPERDLVLLKSDTAKVIAVENPRPGKPVKSASISVQSSPPVAAVYRDAGNPGTYFLNRALECVGMASEDEIRAGALWIEVENVSDRALSELESKAVFVDQMTKEKVAETKWAAVRDLATKGARARIQYDLSGLGKVGNLSFLVKIRQQSL
jgi:hypothetical protein